MSNPRQNDFLRGAIASKFVRDDDAGPASAALQQLAKEADSGKPVALRLNQNVNYGAVLIDGTPEIMLHSVDL